MGDTDQPNVAGATGGFAVDAGVDTAADGVINNLVDSVASHIPGGAGMETVLNTGVDQQANNLINGEISNLEGMFTHKDG
jgi:hypothetical protein